jgi:hypothetical protein
MQGVLVFANATARDAAITSPQEGQFAFTKDNDSLWYYSGSAWVSSGATGDIEGVTAGTGISGGGTSGTVTVTNSMATAIDAKGDLIVGTGADTFARLGVGTNGHTIVADSAEATGLKWAAPSGGSSTFVGCSLYNTTETQTISNNTQTAITWNSENFDTDAFHNNSTNTSRITIPSGKDGKYLFTASGWQTDSTAGLRGVALYKNGSRIRQAWFMPSGTNVYNSAPITCILNLVATDYIEVYILQTSGGNLAYYRGLDGGSQLPQWGWFDAQYLGA